MDKLARFYREMTDEQKQDLRRIIIGGILFILGEVFSHTIPFFMGYGALILFIPGWLVLGAEVLWSALKNIRHGQVFDENFLMCIASIGAFFTGDYGEAVAVMLFFQVGELFEHLAVARSRRSIGELMDLCPDVAHLKTDSGLSDTAPSEIQPGSVIVVRPGERIPLDGVVLNGSSTLDTSAITGEPVPRPVGPGSEALSGCINQEGLLEITVSRPYEESTVSRIMDLVENAAAKKAKSEAFITRFARVYTPAVVIGAALLAFLPPLILRQPFGGWVHQALMFLVVSCPCALVISVPLSFFGGIGGASRKGILAKGSISLENLSKIGVAVLDKTGTLTRGKFAVSEVVPQGIPADELLQKAALCEYYSSHPISASLREGCTLPLDPSRIGDYQETAGHGVTATVDGKTLLCGNEKLLAAAGIAVPAVHQRGTVVYLAEDGVYKGHILIRDEIKPTSKAAVRDLSALGIQTVMLTGDSESSAQPVAEELSIHKVYAGLLPQDKASICEKIMGEASSQGKKVLFAGDGINDAPVLMLADVGAAMGGVGSDAAIEAADLVLMDDNPYKLVTAVKIARKTVQIVWQNIIFALVIKIGILLLTALGITTSMWYAVFADVGVAILAILNAMRCAGIKGD